MRKVGKTCYQPALYRFLGHESHFPSGCHTNKKKAYSDISIGFTISVGLSLDFFGNGYWVWIFSVTANNPSYLLYASLLNTGYFHFALFNSSAFDWLLARKCKQYAKWSLSTVQYPTVRNTHGGIQTMVDLGFCVSTVSESSQSRTPTKIHGLYLPELGQYPLSARAVRPLVLYWGTDGHWKSICSRPSQAVKKFTLKEARIGVHYT